MAAILDLERFASLSADVEAGAPLDALLAREDVARATWDESREEWLAKLAEEVSKRRTALTDRYGAAFAVRLPEAEKAWRVATPPPAPTPAAPLPEPAPVSNPPAAAPPPEPPARKPWATVAMDALPAAPTLPFQPGAPSALPPPSSTPPVRRDTGTLEGTFPAGAGPTPFSQSTTPAAAPAPSAPALGATVPADMISPFAGKVLPFGDPPAPPSARAVPAEEAGTHLTLEQFTSLSAELSIDPAAAGAVRARWGLSEPLHRAELQAWMRRFAQDRALYDRFKALYEHYRGWLLKKRER